MNNSLKAGQGSGLETHFSLLPRPRKPSQTKDLVRRVIEAEAQLNAIAESDTIADLESIPIPESILDSGPEHITTLAPITEEPESQTFGKISTMGERKMVVPGTRDAPKFSAARPRELRRFLRQLEDLWRDADITGDRDKKESVGKYADQECEEEWKALETYEDGYSWDEFKAELLDNYPEASAAERGTPARIRQIVRDADNIELGDTTKLYAYRRAFLAEAAKLRKPPAVMSNRELVELFMGGLSMTMGQAVLQYLGGTIKKKVPEKGKEKEVPRKEMKGEETRRPEDRHDLDEVCRAAGEVSENAQGMLSYKWGAPQQITKRGSSLVQTSTGESTALSSKVESLEETQALEKDRLDAVNKQWGARFDNIEGLMKTLLSQSQEKPTASYIQNLGPGNKFGSQAEPTGKVYKSFSNGSELICFGCGENGHFQNNCERVKALVKNGAIVYNREGRVCLPDGSRVPNVPTGASLVERVDRYYATTKPSQAFYGAFEEMEEKLGSTTSRESTYVNREVDEREQRIAKLEKEYELKERENALVAKQLKLENRTVGKSDIHSFLLEKFDDELSALQGGKLGFH